MSAVLRSAARSEPSPYVHKLRLETRDGANVEIRVAPSLSQVGSRLAAKLVGASVAVALVLAWVGTQVLS
jgi:hypothetical protein